MSCQCFSVLSFFHFLVKAQRAKLKVSDTTAFLYNVETLRHIVEITFNLLRTSQGLNVELNELRNTSEASNSSFTCLAVCAPRCSQSTVWHVVRYAKMYIHKYALHLKSHFWIHNGGKRYIKALQAWTIIHNNTPTSLRVFMTRCCDRVNQRKSSVYPPVVFCGLSPRLSWSVCFFFWRLSCYCCLSIFGLLPSHQHQHLFGPHVEELCTKTLEI